MAKPDKRKKPVACFNASTGELICSFHSIAEAAKESGIDRRAIWANLKGRKKQAGDYVWKYLLTEPPHKMTEKEYRSHPAISRSELWKLDESPEKFKWFRDHPMPPTPTLLFGQAVHKLLLEPETFDRDFAVMPEYDRRTKDGREAYSAFLDGVCGRSVITAADYQKAVEMAKKALSVPAVAELLTGKHEEPFFWTDEDTGEECKCRVDCLNETDGTYTVVDYKSANSAKTEVFNRDIFKYGYHVQAAHYTTGVMKSLDLTERPDFVFIVQEKSPPYAVNIITVPPEVMLAGIDKNRELLGIYHECKVTGYWPGYMGMLDEPNEAYLPSWLSLGVDESDE